MDNLCHTVAGAVLAEAGLRRRTPLALPTLLLGANLPDLNALAYAARIRKAYGEQAATRVQENPYRLARDVPGIGFVVADRIAQGMGIARDSPQRIQAGVLHVLESLTDEGHVFFRLDGAQRR